MSYYNGKSLLMFAKVLRDLIPRQRIASSLILGQNHNGLWLNTVYAQKKIDVTTLFSSFMFYILLV